MDKKIKKLEHYKEVWRWYGPRVEKEFNHNTLIDRKWYHNTEDDDYIGPYDTEKLANDALYTYCKMVLGAEPLAKDG